MSHLSNATMFETVALWVVLGIAVLGLLYALLLRRQVMRNDKGSSQMQVIWNAIREGADAYLGRQLRTIIPLIIVLTVVLFFSVYVVAPSEAANAGSPATRKETPGFPAVRLWEQPRLRGTLWRRENCSDWNIRFPTSGRISRSSPSGFRVRTSTAMLRSFKHRR